MALQRHVDVATPKWSCFSKRVSLAMLRLIVYYWTHRNISCCVIGVKSEIDQIMLDMYLMTILLYGCNLFN